MKNAEGNEICPTCKFPCIEAEYYPDGYCSDFCERTNDAQKEAYLRMKPGDWGRYPCAKCGVCIEDEYPESSPYCVGCWDDVKLERSQKALQDVLVNMPSWQDVQGETGLSEERCREILEITQGKFE